MPKAPAGSAPVNFSALTMLPQAQQPTPQPAPTTQPKLTSDQFAQSIKAKYPAYANVDNATLTQKMLAKYPQYSDRVDLNPVPPAPAQTASELDYTAPFTQIATGHPVQGVFSALKLGAQGIMNAPAAIKEQASQGFQQIKQGAKDSAAVPLGPKRLEPTLSAVSGAASVLSAPLAPLFKPISAIVQKGQDTFSNNPTAQKLAQKLPNIQYDRYAKIAGDVSNIAGTIAGAADLPTASDITAKVKNTAADLQTKASTKAVDTIANAYRETAGQTIKANKTLGKSLAKGNDPAQWLAERNITPTIEEGKMHTADQQARINTDAQPMNEHLNIALKEIQPSVPEPKVDDVRAKALQYVEQQKGLTETAMETKKAHINEEFNLIKKKYGDTIDLSTLNSKKSAFWGATPFDSTKPYLKDANYAMGKAAQKTIEETVPKDAVPVHELNREIGKMRDAQKFLESLDGRAVKGGRLGKYFARTIGATIGHGVGGPLGAIGGALGGDAIARALQSTTFSNPVRQMLLRNLALKDPEAYQQALKFIENAKAARGTRLALPPASGKSPAAIELPSAGVLKGQQVLREAGTPPTLPPGQLPHPILGSLPNILARAPKK